METKESLRATIFNHFHHLCRYIREHWDQLVISWLMVCLFLGVIWASYRYIPPAELDIRHTLVTAAEKYLGYSEADGSHQQIIDLYNSYTPLPRAYAVTYEDNWCAAFASASAFDAGLDTVIPMECSCQQQILRFAEIGCWREDECYLPKPGDYIYYVWDEWRKGDCTAWANHVGIVADTFGPIIKVIEGNKDDSVAYLYIFLNNITIRGYGLPDYPGIIQ